MNKYILIKVKNNISRFINKCKDRNIELYKIEYINKNEIIVKIKKEDFNNIKIFNYYSQIDFYKNIGLDYLKDKIYKQRYFILIFTILLLLMYFCSNIILKVNVIHSNKEVRELVLDELEERGIKKFSYKKNFKDLEKIKEDILENNKDKLEWLSITNIGMTYVIRVEERIIDKIEETETYCNIIAKKDALVSKIIATNGDILVAVNDYVHKNDVLISGDIIFNDGIMGSVCAKGEVIGKVWYTTNITLNRNYEEKVYTGKTRFNFVLNHKILRKNKYTKYDKKYIIKNRFFSIYKEIEYKEVTKKYNEEEGINKALDNIDKKFKTKLGNLGSIVSKKVLKKEINNSTIYIEAFVVTEEVISEVKKE